MRHGQTLGSEIFTAQPPGFYTLIRAGEAVFGATVSGGRNTVIAFALVGLVGAYLIGRRCSGAAAGLVAAALLAVAPPFPTFAANISADLPSFALGLLALAFLLFALDGPGAARPLGALRRAAGDVDLGEAERVDAPGARCRFPLGAARLRPPPDARRARRRLRRGRARTRRSATGAGCTGSGWARSTITTRARSVPVPGLGLGDNVHRVVHFLDFRTPFGWLVLLALVVWLTPLRPRLRVPLWPLVAWAAASALFLIWHHPLHDNHMVLLAVTLAVPAGISPRAAAAQLGGRRALAAGLVLGLCAPPRGSPRKWRRDDRNAAGRACGRGLGRESGSTGSRAPATSSSPTSRSSTCSRAGRARANWSTPPSSCFLDSGLLTEEQVLDVIERDHVRAVVAARAFRAHPRLLAELARRFPRQLDHGGLTIYLRA